MAITKKIVDLFGGTLDLESEPGKGTKFTLMLPFRISDTFSYDMTVPLPDLNVLIADDDTVMCEYTVQMLDQLGIHSDWVSSGTDAITKIEAKHQQNSQYDAIIIDWQMPQMDGLQTAQTIRTKFGKELPILIISAYDWSDIEDDAISAGVSGFLTKPIFPSTLFRGMKEYVLKQEKTTEIKNKTYDFHGKKVLLVEDNELNRIIATELLADTGIQIETAFDGEEGVEMFKRSLESYYDLILMDIQMPVMDGYTATRQIRKLDRKDASSIPILAMTADAFMEDILAARESGMDGHLAKPLDIRIVKQELDKFLNKETVQ